MKKLAFVLGIVNLLIFSANSYGFDNIGLIPVQPNGVFSTLSAYTIGEQKTGVMVSVDRSIEPNFYRFSLALEYGTSENTEVLANFPFVTGYNGLEGLDDISFGFKHKIIDEKRFGPTISYLIGFSAPGRDVFSSEGNFGGGIILSKRVGPFQGSINLFYYKPTKATLEDMFETRIGFDLAAGHNFDILSELFIRKGHFSESIEQIEGRIGYRVKTAKNSRALLGLGYDFKNRTPEWRLFFSISFIFPEEVNEIKRIYEEE